MGGEFVAAGSAVDLVHAGLEGLEIFGLGRGGGLAEGDRFASGLFRAGRGTGRGRARFRTRRFGRQECGLVGLGWSRAFRLAGVALFRDGRG